MLKRMYKKNIIISSIILLLITILSIIPNNKNNNIEQRVSYVNYELNTQEVYLLDNNNYLNRVKIGTHNTKEELVNELIEILTCSSNSSDKIPDGFKCILNSNTKINSISIKDDLIKIDFNKYLLDTSKELEEKTIESIVYTLTNIDNINKIIILIDGNMLTKLPQNNITLPSTLSREFGINKKYKLTSTKNINKTTIYYINKLNNKNYYTPITLINNDTREKIEIIIDELSNRFISNNFNSYLNNNTKVLNSYIKDNTMHINFNENILSGLNNNDIIEEVIYTISLSINDNYDIKNVFFDVNSKEIAKTAIKSLE